MPTLNPNTFQPKGNRFLVKRYSLPEQTAAGLYLLGREYPTMGKIVSRYGNGLEVQWWQDINYTYKQFNDDLVLLDYDDINFVVSNNQAKAFNDRVILEPIDLFEPIKTQLIIKSNYLARYQKGLVKSVGARVDNDLLNKTVIFDPNLINSVTFNGQTLYITREADLLAVLE